MSLGLITDELIVRQPVEAQAIIRLLLAKLEAELRVLRKTLRNSSVPPGSAKPMPKKKGKSKRKRGGRPGHSKSERPLIPVEQCDRVVDPHPEACRRRTERRKSHVGRLGTTAASGVGAARNQARHHRVSASSGRVPVLSHADVRRAARRRAVRPNRTATDRVRRAADGLFPPEQTPHDDVPQPDLESVVQP